MPSYFFHLFFDLHAPISPIVRSLPELSGLSQSQISILPAWVPPPGTNIFATNLPSHQPSVSFKKARKAEELLPQEQEIKNKDKETQSTESLPGDTYEHLDWRFGKIAVESVDMDPKDLPTLSVSSSPTHGKKPSTSVSLPGGSAAKAHFIPLESKNTEFGYGVVHLYRDVYETPGLYNPKQDLITGENGEVEDDDALTTVAILAVPSYMTASDFMGFVGEETRDKVSHFRMIRTGKANRYMVLMKFRRKEDAKKFVAEFNGKVFNSMEVWRTVPLS